MATQLAVDSIATDVSWKRGRAPEPMMTRFIKCVFMSGMYTNILPK